MATFHSVKKLSPPSWFFLTVLLAFQLVDPTDGSENTPSLLVAACLKQSNCWLRYRFNYADHWNDCHGDQFLKRTIYDLFVGVVLCSTSR
ncbi:hypothetical protein LSAT2_023797 [Lamellibrachia satsuma]|nr:hypothetical protein LSAT2_023797 [Lamellibrachia satsuma]